MIRRATPVTRSTRSAAREKAHADHGAWLPVATDFSIQRSVKLRGLVAWGAIGARHGGEPDSPRTRVGAFDAGRFQKPHDASAGAIDAIRSGAFSSLVSVAHARGAPAVMGTTGNEHAHLVLRAAPRPNFPRARSRRDGVAAEKRTAARTS